MMRRLSLTVGLVAAALGLTILVDTALADGCCGCCCCCCNPNCPNPGQPSTDTKACATGVYTCSSYNNNPTLCGSLWLKGDTWNVRSFPKCCTTPDPPPNSTCVGLLQNCRQLVTCIFQNGVCTPNPSNNAWRQATCPTSQPCN